MKWWLISDKNVKQLQEALETACDALHSLDSGLHISDTVPSDFSEGALKDILHVVNVWHEIEKESSEIFHKPLYSHALHVGAAKYLEKVQKLITKYVPE